MSDRDLDMREIKDIIRSYEFEPIGPELEELDEIPHVCLWLMVGQKNIKPSVLPPLLGYIRIFKKDHPFTKTYFRVVNSPWWVNVYYSVSMELHMWWYKLKTKLGKIWTN